MATRHRAGVRDPRDLGMRRREGQRGRGGGEDAGTRRTIAAPDRDSPRAALFFRSGRPPYSALVPEPVVHRVAIKAPVASKMLVVVVVVSVFASPPSSISTSAVKGIVASVVAKESEGSGVDLSKSEQHAEQTAPAQDCEPGQTGPASDL